MSVLKYCVTCCSLNDVLIMKHFLYRVFILLLDRKALVQCSARSFANIVSHAASRGGLTVDDGRWTDGGMNWIELAQDMERWPVLVNAVMKLRDPENVGNFLTS